MPALAADINSAPYTTLRREDRLEIVSQWQHGECSEPTLFVSVEYDWAGEGQISW